jgi:hypothetical protein
VANRNQPGCACCGNYDCDNPGQFAISMNASEISCVAATSICRRSDDGFNCCACVVINPFTSGCREMLCSGVGFPDTFAAQFTFSGTAQHKYYTAGQGAEIVPVAGDPPASADKCCCSGPELQATLDYSFTKTINVKPIIISQPLYIRVCVYFTDTLTTGDTAPVKRWVVYSEYWKRYSVSYSGYGSSTYSRTIPAVPLCHEKWNVDTCGSNCTLEQIPCSPNDPDNVNFWLSETYEFKDIPTPRVKIYNTKPSGVIIFTDEDLGTDYEVFLCKPFGQLYEDTQVEFDIPAPPCLCDGINPRDVYSPTVTHRPRCLTGLPKDCGCAVNETAFPDCPPYEGEPGTTPCDFINDNPCILDPVNFGGSGTQCWTFTPNIPDALDFCAPRCYGTDLGGGTDWYTTRRYGQSNPIGQFASNPCSGTAIALPDISSDPFDASQGNCVYRDGDDKGCWGYGPLYVGSGSNAPWINCGIMPVCAFERLIFPTNCTSYFNPITCYDKFGVPTSPDSSCFTNLVPDGGCPDRACLCGDTTRWTCYEHAYSDNRNPVNIQTPQPVVHLQQNTVSYSVTCSVGEKVLVQAPSPTWSINLDWSQVPDPTNWTTIEYDCTPNTSTITSKQITGVNIAGSIQLRIDPGTGSIPTLYYKITSTQQTGTVTGPPDGTWTAITAVTTITVNNNEWVSFCTYDSTGSTSSRTATVTANPGACESELDTFVYQSTCPADVTPCSVNWTTTTYSGVNDEANIVSQQITCINTTITLQIQPGSGSIPTLYYKITSTQQTGNVSGTPDGTWTPVGSNTNILVSNNQWLSFVAYTNPSNNGSRTATIVNVTDSNTTLDTFTYDSTI